ncbi:hypothetical protein SCARR_02910 [Pontiella sulfatireligans]|uniref:Uncharacterized protein n=1 Tax=Pontiella sulfatireligans TaxID=2750658 RepID=A0A6C2ULQ4_9BACT|nr:hypothetical protein SCARR_02910 [Pontiella sulfatireligans]
MRSIFTSNMAHSKSAITSSRTPFARPPSAKRTSSSSVVRNPAKPAPSSIASLKPAESSISIQPTTCVKPSAPCRPCNSPKLPTGRLPAGNQSAEPAESNPVKAVAEKPHTKEAVCATSEMADPAYFGIASIYPKLGNFWRKRAEFIAVELRFSRGVGLPRISGLLIG